MSFLGGIEWDGDFVNGVLLVAAALALVGLGFLWGRWRALVALAVVWTVPLVLLDALYFGLGVNLAGYCGEPACDPGPLPASLGLVVLPVALALAAAGVVLRGRRRRASVR